MSITYQCEHCGRWETVRESKVGTTARCKDCGHQMVVPNTPDLFDDTIDGPAGGAATSQGRATSAIPSGPRTTRFNPVSTASSTSSSTSPETPEPSEKKSWLWVVGLIAFMLFKFTMRGGVAPPRPRAFRPNFPPPPATAKPNLGNFDAPIVMPSSYPEIGPGREIEPGILLHEIKLRPAPNLKPAPPGHSGTLWLYLPAKDKAAKSLPCVLIAPAGSDLWTGMALAEGDRPEHLPYVRAGFAVLSFDLDGPDPTPQPNRIPVGPMTTFLRARAGLVNGRIAMAFLRDKVPQVDPGRLYVAGHSSAATFALLFAENQPELKACIAYAPVCDLMAHFGARVVGNLRRAGYSDLVTRFSPRNNEAKLDCPVFLFQSRDDENVKPQETIACADRLKEMNKRVTLDVVESGGHYDSMLNEGIPRAIEWLKARDAEVRAKK